MNRPASAVAALAASLVLTTGAGATSTSPSLTVTPQVVRRGESLLIRGSAGSCPVGDTVFIISRALRRTHEFAGVPAVLAKVRLGGRFRTTARIPLRKPPGRYVFTARCGGGNLGIAARLTVLR